MSDDEGLQILRFEDMEPVETVKYEPPEPLSDEEIESKLKELGAITGEDLFKTYEFDVTYIVGRSQNHTFTPVSEMVCGGRSPVYDGGMSQSLELTVEGESPITTLSFGGLSRVQTGDRIIAQVPLFETKSFWTGRSPIGSHDESQKYFAPREPRDVETAILMEYFRNGKAAGKDYSVEFDQYSKL